MSLKNNISILILSLFIYNSFGFLAVHPFLSMYYKYLGMQRANIPSEEELIELLVFNKEDILDNRIDFKWIHSREFKYNGDMYDIVKKEESDQQLILYCINDTKEKKLEEEFEKRINSNSANNKQRQNLNHSTTLSEPVQEEQVKFYPGTNCIFTFYLNSSYSSIHSEIPSPPPRLV